MTPCPKPVKREPKPRRPLKRSWMKAPHSKFCACSKCERKRTRRESDPAYLDFVRSLPCRVYSTTDFPCFGRIHAHHAIHRSQGGKDDSAVPLCDRHHRQWHDANGVFAGLSKFERFAWATRAIARTQAAYRGQR